MLVSDTQMLRSVTFEVGGFCHATVIIHVLSFS